MSKRGRDIKITQSITERNTRSLERYLQELGKYDVLRPEEEVSLAAKARQGDQAAMEQLVKSNLRFVVSVAKKYQHFGVPLEDLISEGNIGLMTAAKRFDESRGFKFISFAVWWIRESILSCLSEKRRIVRLPQNQINLLGQIKSATESLEHRFEREPTEKELAEFMETDVIKIIDAKFHSHWVASLDEPNISEEGYSLLEKLANGDENAEHQLMRESMEQELGSLMHVLSSRERQIIEMSYGFGGAPEATTIGKKLGLSTERIRQIKTEAMNKLRKRALHCQITEPMGK